LGDGWKDVGYYHSHPAGTEFSKADNDLAQKYYPFFLGVDGKVKVIEKTYEEVPMVYRGKQIGTRKESTSTFSNVNPGTGATTPYTPKR
jgi:proteasome lid subunit RPN8/RPN11